MTNTLYDLLAALVGAPALPGAKCRGRAHLFDPAERGEDPDLTEYRHQHALTLCRTCTALASCGEWVDSLPKSKKPAGVIAGRIRTVSRPGIDATA